jgi:cysteinyl-tRNA synthetase
MLHIYNSLTKNEELFEPLVKGKVGLYVCGITVYDNSHIGHARTYIIFDMVLRYMRYLGYQVKYVRNITDIEDKIIKRSQENNEPWQELTKRYIKAMHEDFQTLNLLEADVEPKATDHIPEMLQLVQQLIDKGFAYVGGTGDVYYDIEKFKDYGCLSHRHQEDLLAGSRIEVNEAKKNPMDFVLWKMAKPGEPFWESPWGKGRPGWHLECSVMAMKNLGETFDIHGGGPDLKFPHHENERAQSEAATGKRFVKLWMHSGYLQIDKEKMSKSLGNFITIREFLESYHPEILRYFNLISHYRSPVDYAQDNIDSAISGMERLYTALRGLPIDKDSDSAKSSQATHAGSFKGTENKTKLEKVNESKQGNETGNQHDYEERFQKAMNDDFNTPIAFSVLFDLARDINRARESDPALALKLGTLLKKLGNILGLLYSEPEAFLQSVVKGGALETWAIEDLIAKRNEARKDKNWALADQFRNELLKQGIALEDTSSGTLWRRETSIEE